MAYESVLALLKQWLESHGYSSEEIAECIEYITTRHE
jgi:hypothetical protein